MPPQMQNTPPNNNQISPSNGQMHNPNPQRPQPQQNLSNKKQSFFKSKKFKYILGLVIAFLLVGGILFAMLNKPKEPVTPTTTTIKFWGTSIDESIMHELIADFESQNPYIKVKYEKQSDSEYKNRLTTRLSLGNTLNLPDVMEIEEAWVSDLSTYLARAQNTEINNKFSSQQIRNNSVKNLQYAYPYRFDSLALAFNTKHLSEKGLNETDFIQLDWSSLLSRAKSLTISQTVQSENNNISMKFDRVGMAIGSPEEVTNADKILQLLFIQNDATIFDEAKSLYFLDQKSEESIDFYTKFTTEKVWDKSIGNDIDAFTKEKVSMALVTSEDITKIQSLNPKLQFKVVSPPKISTIRNLSLSTSLALPRVSTKSGSVNIFINFLSKPENQKKLFDSKNSIKYIPSTTESLNSIPKESPFSVFADLSLTAERFNVKKYEEVSELMSEYLIDEFKKYYSITNSNNRVFRLETKKLEALLNSTLEKK